MKSYYTILFSFLFLTAMNSNAQQATPASGGEATGSGGTVSYTIGQMDYSNAEGVGSANQGVQQPYEISVVAGLNEGGISLTCNIYPNPATDFVVLTTEKDAFKSMSYMLYDVNNKLIRKEKLAGDKTTIPMEGLTDAIYMLRVANNDLEVKSFKIVKTK